MKKNLIFFGKNHDILACIERIFSNNDKFNVMLVTKLQDLFIYLNRQFYDGVLLGSGLTEEEEKTVGIWLKQNSPDTRLITHYGGGSGLLMNELLIAFSESTE